MSSGPAPLLLALTVVAAGFAGCSTTERTVDEAAGGCGQVIALWEQPGLYERANATAEVEGWGVEREPASSGLGLAADAIVEAWGRRGYALAEVSWASETLNEISLHADGTVVASSFHNGSDPAIEEEYRAFVAKVAHLDAEETNRTAQAFLDSETKTGSGTDGRGERYHIYEFTVDLEGPWNVTPLAEDVGLSPEKRGQMPVRGGEMSAPHPARGPWRFTFAFDRVVAEPGPGTRDRPTLHVNPLNVTLAEFPASETNTSAAHDHLQAAFDELDWGHPTVDVGRIGPGDVC